ncbi:MAG: thioredoxin family protein [Paludibacteraceae bacterium]|nr:thioredoxin family protein [Paludibacteraceae bacterium]
MKRIILLLHTLFAICLVFGQIENPVKWNITCSEANAEDMVTITFKANIDEGWHIYGMDMPSDGPISTSFNITKKENAQIIGKTETKTQTDCGMSEMFAMELCEYKGNVTFTQKLKVSPSDGYNIAGYVEFMACNNTNCLAPKKEQFSFKQKAKKECAGEAAPSQPDTAKTANIVPLQIPTVGNHQEKIDTWKPVIDQMKEYGAVNPAKESLWIIFCMGLIGGLLAILTPCVWPIIPMTVSFFLKKDGKKSALLYGASILLIYVGLGVILTLCFGANALNELSTSAMFNLFLFVLLVLFAISFFGGFELSLPGSWSTKIDSKVDQTAGIVSILFMALTLVVVSFSCTGPIVGTLLVEVSSGNNILAPIIGMLGFAIALAVPFTLFAFFPNLLKKLPKSGSWLNTTKVLLGFFELAFSLKFLSVADMTNNWGLLSRETFLAIWIVIFFVAGLYILGIIRFKGEPENEGISVLRLFGGGATWAFAIYLIPGLWGAPLKAVSAFTPPMYTQDFNLGQENHTIFSDYDEAIEYAKKEGKPILVDFSGYGCVNCREMEAVVFNDPSVKQTIQEEFVLTTLYVDDRKELQEPTTLNIDGSEATVTTIGEKWSYLEEHKFGANTQPFYIIVDEKGNALSKSYSYKKDVAEFTKFLKEGLDNYKQKQ